jgi:metal-responsive CopG/Arc/MetJ family transcriptional regulator
MGKQQVSTSIDERLVTKIQHAAKAKEYKGNATAVIEDALEYFFSSNKKDKTKDVLIHIIYPGIITTLLLFIANATDGINKKMITTGEINLELVNLGNTFFLIGFTSLGIMLPLLYLFITKYKEKN